jgi:4'-phosphopantetheinyl transferase EntD
MHTIAPSGVRYDIRRISEEWIEHLHPEEQATTTGFAHTRRTEFATGRASVRRLVRELSSSDLPILVGERRAPILPPGLQASISHCDTFVATVATKAADIVGLGVDIEFHDRVTPDIIDALLSRSEKAKLKSERHPRSLACYFSAKEAVFKAIHALIGKYIDFLDIDLIISCDRFVAQPLFYDPTLEDIVVKGRVTQCGLYVLAIAWVSSSHQSNRA